MKNNDIIRFAFTALLLYAMWTGPAWVTKLCVTLTLVSVECIAFTLRGVADPTR